MMTKELVGMAQSLEHQVLSQDWMIAWYTASKLQNEIEAIKWHCKAKEEERLVQIAEANRIA